MIVQRMEPVSWLALAYVPVVFYKAARLRRLLPGIHMGLVQHCHQAVRLRYSYAFQ